MPVRSASSTWVQPRSLRRRARRCPIVSEVVFSGALAAFLRGITGSGRPQVGRMSGEVKTAPPPISMLVPDDTEFDIEENTYTDVRPNGHYVLTMSEVK